MGISLVLIVSLIAITGVIAQELSHTRSAASDAQIRFAIENKYDDTGPGAKKRDTAYSTYKNLEDALISYLDDPDTKLPEYERQKAIAAFQIPIRENTPIRKYPKTVEEYTGYKITERPNQYQIPQQQYYPPILDLNNYEFNNLQNNYINKINDGFSYHKVQSVKSSPLSLAHYTKDKEIEDNYNQFDPNPQYSFSYGVHDKRTGDSKSAHETRNDGVVKGFYTFMDADGKQRTVHYTADDHLGFRATVQRSVSNQQ